MRRPRAPRADPNGYVLWIATLRAQKRPELLIEMARRMPQHRFMLVGGSDPGERGQAYAQAVRAAAAALPNVRVQGFTPFEQADRLFDGARVVVNTSEYEGFSQHVPPGLGAGSAHRGLHRHGFAPGGRAGLRHRLRGRVRERAP
jgi:glycosyltransferase involved in cell wall biosynthesis